MELPQSSKCLKSSSETSVLSGGGKDSLTQLLRPQTQHPTGALGRSFLSRLWEWWLAPRASAGTGWEPMSSTATIASLASLYHP